MPADIYGPPIPFEIYKNEALGRLAIRLSNFSTGLAGVILLHTEAINLLENRSVYLQGDNIWFDPTPLNMQISFETTEFKELVAVSRLGSESNAFSEIVKELVRSLRRTLITESIELLTDFVKQHKLFDNLNKQPWFHYARFVRNAMSHDYKFCFFKRDLDFLPVTWNDITIDASMEGLDLQASILTPMAAVGLHRNMSAWIAAC